LGAANTVNHFIQIEYRVNGIKFIRTYNNMKKIWTKLHLLLGDKVELDLGNYSLVSSNKQIVIALKDRLREAQRVISCLNMDPNPLAVAKNKVSFVKP